jgi:hypothetical protein
MTSGTTGAETTVEPAAKITEYSTVPASLVEDRETVFGLWREGLSHGGKPEAKLAWYYERNPVSVPDVLFLQKKGVASPVGVAAIGSRRMRFGDESLLSCEMVDFVVAPKHRALSPAKFLMGEVRRQCLITHDILYGLPNPQSRAVVKRIGYQYVGEMVRRVRVLRTAGYLSHYLPAWLGNLIGPLIDRVRVMAQSLGGANHGYTTAWVEQPDAEFDRLWAETVEPEVIMGVRDREYLTWRFADCPLEKCSFFVLRDPAASRLLGYAVCEVQDDTLQVYDFLIDDKTPGASACLWRELSLAAYRAGHTKLSVEFLGPQRMQQRLQVAGLRARETRPLYATTDSKWNTLLDNEHWYMTSADEDG